MDDNTKFIKFHRHRFDESTEKLYLKNIDHIAKRMKFQY